MCAENIPELKYIPDIKLYKLESLLDVVRIFDNITYLETLRIDHQELPLRSFSSFDVDFADIK